MLIETIRATDYHNLNLIPSDFSLRNLDLELACEKRPDRRLKKSLDAVKDDYDIVILLCASTISQLSANIFKMADWLLIPLISTNLSLRAYNKLRRFTAAKGRDKKALLPLFLWSTNASDYIEISLSILLPRMLNCCKPTSPALARLNLWAYHERRLALLLLTMLEGAFEALWRALLMRPGLPLKPEPDGA